MNQAVMDRPPLTQIVGKVVEIEQAPAHNRSGKIHLEGSDDPLSAFPDKMRLVHIGETYEFGCEDKPWNGRTYHNVKTVRPAAPSRAMQTPPERNAPIPQSKQPQGKKMDQSYYRPTSPRDSERMFCCSVLNAFIQTGRVNNEVEVLVQYVNALREVYQRTFGADDD